MTDIYPGAAGETPQDGRQAAAPIGPDEVRAAYQTLLKYKAGKANLEKRIIDNQQWYKLRQWECLRRRGGEREQSAQRETHPRGQRIGPRMEVGQPPGDRLQKRRC